MTDSYRADGLINVFTGQGDPQKDPASYTTVLPRIFTPQELDDYYEGYQICQRVVDFYPENATQAWGKFTVGGEEGDPDLVAWVNQTLKDIKVTTPLHEYRGVDAAFGVAGFNANMTGNGAIIMLCDDTDDWSQPLFNDKDNLLPGTNLTRIDRLHVLDNTLIHPDMTGVFGGSSRMTHYKVTISSRVVDLMGSRLSDRIHKDRVLWFRGRKSSDSRLFRNSGRDLSVLSGFLNAFIRYESSLDYLLRGVSQHSTWVWEIEGLLDDLKRNCDAEAFYRRRLEAAQMGMGLYRAYVTDRSKETVREVKRDISNIPPSIDQFIRDLVAESNLPRPILLGDFAESGLGAAEGAHQALINTLVSGYQSTKLQSNLFAILRLLLQIPINPAKGEVPGSWGWSWADVYPQSAKERSEIYFNNTRADALNVKYQILAPEEVAKSHYYGSEYDPNITIDWANRSPQQPAPTPIEDDGGMTLDALSTSETFTPPKGAIANAKKILKWREEHPNEIKGMTRVGWVRASQLASGEPISFDVVKRMAQFNRHRKNSKLKPEFKAAPYKQAGYVAWLGWGGDAGIDWAIATVEKVRKQRSDAFPYVKRRFQYEGMTLAMEYMPDDNRHGKKLKVAGYGHIQKHKGGDGEALDCYVSTALLKALDNDELWDEHRYYVVTQITPQDVEEKVFLGFHSEQEVEDAYLSIMPERFYAGVSEIMQSDLKDYRADEETPKFKVEGKAGTLAKLNATAPVDEDDIDTVLNEWKAIAPDKYLNLLEAELGQ